MQGRTSSTLDSTSLRTVRSSQPLAQVPSNSRLELCEAVRTPLSAANSVVRKEEAAWVVALLDRLIDLQPRVVVAPERALPIGLEIVALGEVGAAVGRNTRYFVHGAADCRRVSASERHVGLVPRYAWIGRLLLGPRDQEGKRICADIDGFNPPWSILSRQRHEIL